MDGMIAFLEGLSFWHWFALGAGLMIIEILTPTFYFIWPGAAAMAVGLLLLVLPELPWTVTLSVFGTLSVVATLVWHSYFKPRGGDRAGRMALNQRSTRYIGRRAVVADGFRGARGSILLDDTRWQAVNDSGTDLAPGAPVEIVGADGVILHVRPA
jgi:membrane protein implicated in regulation of membrane protease activity